MKREARGLQNLPASGETISIIFAVISASQGKAKQLRKLAAKISTKKRISLRDTRM